MRGEVFREFFLGFVKLHVLHHASQGPVYGLALLRELARHGYRLSPGTLYPTLHLMEREGYLRCQARLVEGRWRKYYLATPAGKRLLLASRGKIRELTAELLAHPKGHPGPGRGQG
jgi:DNA-binding PadR family transcriptional regulator